MSYSDSDANGDRQPDANSDTDSNSNRKSESDADADRDSNRSTVFANTDTNSHADADTSRSVIELVIGSTLLEPSQEIRGAIFPVAAISDRRTGRRSETAATSSGTAFRITSS